MDGGIVEGRNQSLANGAILWSDKAVVFIKGEVKALRGTAREGF